MPHVDIDLSSPRPAAVSYLKAMSAGDLESLRTSTIGTDEQRKAAEAYSALIHGMREYDEAIIQHFGNQSVSDHVELRQKLMEMVDDRIARTEQGIVSESDEDARISPGFNGMALQARPPIILKKVKGLWKVDLAATAERDSSLTKETADKNRAIGEALLKISKDINRGRYKSFADLQRDADAGVP